MKRISPIYPTKLFLTFYFFFIPVVHSALPLKMDDEALPSLAPMLEKVTPAVVNIATEGRMQLRQSPLFADPLFRRFFNIPDGPIERKTSSLGSGVVVDSKRGLILTNNHVIANAVQITVTLRDGRQLEAQVVGTDPETDVAVIKVPVDDLIDIKIASSDDLQVGDFVVAIGNPFGLGQTVTSGIISALSRSGLGIEGYEDFIQTDASINPGNSGGALVNLRGQLVGINTAILSQSGGNIGIGFAIPINLALQIMEQLIETGEVKRGFLGVSTQDLNPELVEAFGLDRQHGVIINEVLDGSPAAKAGLKLGDIILSVDGKRIKNAAGLRNRIGLLPAGKKIMFKILREGKERDFIVTIAENPRQKINVKTNVINKLLRGVTISDIKPDSPYYGKVEGVVVVNVRRGVAWRSGLRNGDLITSVNKVEIKNLQHFLSLVDKQDNSLLLRIIRGRMATFIVIKETN